MADAAFAEVAKLARDLDTGKSRVGRTSSDAVRRAARAAERQQKASAPVDSGTLRDSIGVDFYGTGNSRRFTAVVGPTEYYGRYVEWGTVHTEARPFVGPSLDPAADILEKAAERVDPL